MVAEIPNILRDPILMMSIAAFVAVGLLVFLFAQFLRWITKDHLAVAGGAPRPAGGAKDASAVAELSATRLSPLDIDLRKAGIYHATARRDYLLARNAILLLILAIAIVMAIVVGFDRPAMMYRIAGGGLVIACICWAVPRMVLRRKGKQRVDRIRRSLPSALDMIAMCMTGGLSFDKSLAYVSRELYATFPDLAAELRIVGKHAEMNSVAMALDQFAQRIDTEEARTIAALVSQGQRLGTGLVPSIQEYADSTRLKWRQMADEQASRSVVQLLLPIAFCLLPSIFILMWGPALIELWTFLQQFEGVRGIDTSVINNALNGAVTLPF